MINDKLNIVIEHGDLHVYHTPISREVFEASYRIISATKAAMFGKGLAYAADAGPQIAALRLKDEGKLDALERGDVNDKGELQDGGASALLAEIKRLTLVLCPTPNGFENLPVDNAIARDFLDEEDWAEIESRLVFFTCAYAMVAKSKRQQMAEGLSGILKGSITSLSPTEYADSLPKSKKEDDTQTIS